MLIHEQEMCGGVRKHDFEKWRRILRLGLVLGLVFYLAFSNG